MKLICQYLGGSRAYGLETSDSDFDQRGVFVHSEVKYIIGLNKHDHQVTQTEVKDESYKEFRHALQLLKNANTEVVEMLYNYTWIDLGPEWKEVMACRHELVDSERLFSCLRGYMQGELKLANGEKRTGRLGGKRKEAIDKYGFSPKNWVQYLRLSWCGAYYFDHGIFPVKIKDYNEKFSDFLLKIKTEPQKFSKEELNVLAETHERELIHAFEHRKSSTKFNEDLANDLCLQVYGPKIIAMLKIKSKNTP